MQEQHPHETAILVSKRTMDIVVALMLLAVAGIGIVESNRMGFGWEEGVGPAAGFFPFIVSVLLAIASLYNLTMAILKRDEDWAEDFVSIVGFQRILMIIVPLILFIAAIHYIGIYVASALFIAGFMIAFGHSSLVKAAAVGIGVPLALFFMFERWFLVPLPKGPLEAMLGF
ncbi:MAG: tripartite tricarboxylate transporter TctB family protein [Hyphomicrobiaceae bacterium]|nr:tripartite tricarboxylate transporter TctB family protein [Hyphomicrobiaceae bacterium]